MNLNLSIDDLFIKDHKIYNYSYGNVFYAAIYLEF